MSQTAEKSTKKISTYSMAVIAMFTAMLCVSAYITITLPNGSHLSFLNFTVIFILLLFPSRKAFCILVLWILTGCLGLPVFAGGNAGVGYLFGPYGGYNFAFLLLSILTPLIRGKKYQKARYIFAAVFSVIVIDAVGTLWMMITAQISLPAAFLAGFVTFLPLDLVKAVIAAQILPKFLNLSIPQTGSRHK